MSVYTCEATEASASSEANGAFVAGIGNDRLLGISDVAQITRTCPVTASRIIDETGYGIVLHRKKYILQSNLLKFLQSQVVA